MTSVLHRSTSMNTLDHFTAILDQCRKLFLAKNRDYGASWKVLRPVALADQIYIKGRRIRTLQELAQGQMQGQVQEGPETEFIGMINYCIMALINLGDGSGANPIKAADLDHLARAIQIDEPELLKKYNKVVAEIRELLIRKNHDYGEAWRDLSLESITDLILQKLLRIRQIHQNQGKTLASEGMDAGFMDIVNYCVFALVKIKEPS